MTGITNNSLHRVFAILALMDQIQNITTCALLHKDGKIFLAKRSKNKKLFPGQFEIPGGHIEFGETLEAGLQRELKEELNIEVQLGPIIFAFTYLSYSNTAHSVEVDYLVTMKNPQQLIELVPTDHTEYRWVTEEEAQELLKDNPKVLEAVTRAFSHLSTLTD